MDVPLLIGTLKPLVVSWAVDSATPFLKLVACESGDSHLDFVAYRRFPSLSVARSDGNAVQVVESVGEFVPATSPIVSQYQMIRLVFDRAVYSRMNMAHSDSEIIDETLYDYSLIPYSINTDESSQNPDEMWAGIELELADWERTGICPDPSAYEVLNSTWLREVRLPERAKSPWKHFLVLGEESYVEVIAYGVSVQEGQPVTF